MGRSGKLLGYSDWIWMSIIIKTKSQNYGVYVFGLIKPNTDKGSMYRPIEIGLIDLKYQQVRRWGEEQYTFIGSRVQCSFLKQQQVQSLEVKIGITRNKSWSSNLPRGVTNLPQQWSLVLFGSYDGQI